MVIIVKKLVPVYTATDKVPKRFLNLRKAVHVASFKHLYPNIPKILTKEYGLNPDEKIVVFWMREISLPHFRRYRLKFKRVYSDKLSDFGDYMQTVRTRSRKRSSAKQSARSPPRQNENQCDI